MTKATSGLAVSIVLLALIAMSQCVDFVRTAAHNEDECKLNMFYMVKALMLTAILDGAYNDRAPQYPASLPAKEVLDGCEYTYMVSQDRTHFLLQHSCPSKTTKHAAMIATENGFCLAQIRTTPSVPYRIKSPISGSDFLGFASSTMSYAFKKFGKYNVIGVRQQNGRVPVILNPSAAQKNFIKRFRLDEIQFVLSRPDVERIIVDYGVTDADVLSTLRNNSK